MVIKSVLYICLNITRTLKYAWAVPEGIWSYVGRRLRASAMRGVANCILSSVSRPPVGQGDGTGVPNFDRGL